MKHTTSTRRPVGLIMIVTLLFATLAPGGAFAGIVGTGNAIAEQTSTLSRTALVEELNRDEVRVQLQAMGVNPDEAVERVAAMTDSEITTLAAGIGNLPAGSDVSLGVALLIILVVFLLVR